MEGEKYSPTPEEMEKAKEMADATEMANAEEIMTPTQRGLSEDREYKAPLREQYKKLQPERGRDGGSITFHAQGHEVHINRDSKNNFYGSIDGLDIGYSGDQGGKDLARQLWERYSSQIVEAEKGFVQSEEDIKMAQDEVRDEGDELVEKRREEKNRKRAEVLRAKAGAIARELLFGGN